MLAGLAGIDTTFGLCKVSAVRHPHLPVPMSGRAQKFWVVRRRLDAPTGRQAALPGEAAQVGPRSDGARMSAPPCRGEVFRPGGGTCPAGVASGRARELAAFARSPIPEWHTPVALSLNRSIYTPDGENGRR